MNRQLHFHDLGLIPYEQAWQLQREHLAATLAVKMANRDLAQVQHTTNHLFFCEHPPVYTLGKSGKAANLLLDEAALAARGVEFFHIERGGDITYHGPGQLVAYPVLDLENFFTDISRYLRTLEEAIIQTAAEFGLVAGRIAGLTGVWVDVDGPKPRKLAALGVKCSRWVTMHGLALNVATDLSYFEQIVPCGINPEEKGVTSLSQELGYAPPMAQVKEVLKQQLASLLQADYVAQAQPG